MQERLEGISETLHRIKRAGCSVDPVQPGNIVYAQTHVSFVILKMAFYFMKAI